jgi:phosphoribosylaminoimidazole (AIR) synthetase
LARDNTRNDHPGGLTYRDAGVDIDAGAELIRRIGPAAVTLAEAEGLGAHALSVALRLGSER